MRQHTVKAMEKAVGNVVEDERKNGKGVWAGACRAGVT